MNPAAWVFDLEGTLYRGEALIPGAVATLRELRRAGAPVRFLTNTTSLGREGLVSRLRGMGFEVEPDEVFCPGAAAAAWLRRHDASARLLVSPATREDFAGVREETVPDHVVLGDLGDDWSFRELNAAFRAIHEHGAGLVGLARSRYWLAADGLRLDVGPFLAGLEYATGVRARVFGKPEAAIFEAVLHSLGLPAARVAMVGDDVRTDIDAATAVGMQAVLVRSGKFRAIDEARSELPAAAGGGAAVGVRIVDSVADLV